MAIAIVAHASANSTDAKSATTAAVDTTGANLIVLACAHDAADATMSDSKSNTWTPLSDYTAAGYHIKMYYCVNPTVGANHTFTAANAGNIYPSIVMVAASGVKKSSPLDQSGGNSITSANDIQPGSVTTTGNGELIVSAIITGASSAPTITTSGWTADATAFVSGKSQAGGIAWWIQPSAGAINPTWHVSAIASGCAAAIATFKAEPGASQAMLPNFGMGLALGFD